MLGNAYKLRAREKKQHIKLNVKYIPTFVDIHMGWIKPTRMHTKIPAVVMSGGRLQGIFLVFMFSKFSVMTIYY